MKKYLFTAVVASAMTFASCNDYLDINQDPNSPGIDDVTSSMLFPGAETAIANYYGGYYRTVGGYVAEHYAQLFGTSNYVGYSQFAVSSSLSSSAYSNLCTRALFNLNTALEKAEREGDNGTVLACTVLRVATYQLFVDAYGEIPYAEGLDIENLSPKYDDGKDIYAALIGELDAAVAHTSAGDQVCTNFLLPDETAGEWIKVANALKLRLLMRESNVVDVKSQLAQLVAQNNFPEGDTEWNCYVADADGAANPFYAQELATFGAQKNVALNLALYAVMNESDDSRMQATWQPNGSGSYTGGVSGTNYPGSTDYPSSYWCMPNIKYNTPVTLISRSEIDFFLCEYEARYGSPAKAAEHYENAIRASFESTGADVADVDRVIAAYPWNAADWKRVVGIQKWVALSCCNNFEAWCEMRRLGYPAFGTVSGDQIYNVNTKVLNTDALTAGCLYTPIQYSTRLGANKVLQRFDYPECSISRNSKAPAVKSPAAPVFWAQQQ